MASAYVCGSPAVSTVAMRACSSTRLRGLYEVTEYLSSLSCTGVRVACLGLDEASGVGEGSSGVDAGLVGAMGLVAGAVVVLTGGGGLGAVVLIGATVRVVSLKDNSLVFGFSFIKDDVV